MSIPRFLQSVAYRRLTIDGVRTLNRGAASTNSVAVPGARRFLHSSSQYLQSEQSPPCINVYRFFWHQVPAEDRRRAVYVSNAPKYAIEDDFRDFFEESNIEVDRIVMVYNYLNLNAAGPAYVVLKSPDLVPAATKLTGEPIFDRRVKIRPSSLTDRSYFNDKPTLEWGWYANTSPLLKDINLRYPRTSPISNIFDSFREGRHVSFSGFPSVRGHDFINLRIREWIYTRLYAFNVLAVSDMIRFRIPSKEQALFANVLFATNEEAEEACILYNNTFYDEHKVKVYRRRPPIKALAASWDPGHNRAHHQPRDFGSAKDTNFESMQDEIYRKWLLGGKDRGRWVPGHKY